MSLRGALLFFATKQSLAVGDCFVGEGPPQRNMATDMKWSFGMAVGKEFCVYIMTNSHNTVLYTGVTNNLARRVQAPIAILVVIIRTESSGYIVPVSPIYLQKACAQHVESQIRHDRNETIKGVGGLL
jgi:hypothetical protein